MGTQLAITWTNFTVPESTHRHHQQPIMVHLHEAKAWDIARFIFSLGLLLFSGVVVCYSIVEQKTSMWKEVPHGQTGVCCLLRVFRRQATTIHGRDDNGSDFLFYVPQIVQTLLLETGLLACVVVVIVAQLMPQIVASLYPVQFLELVVMKPAYYACIGLEFCGFTHFCWVLAAGMAWIFRMKKEEGEITVVNVNKGNGLHSNGITIGKSYANEGIDLP